MGHFQDHIRRKLTDNMISLTGQAADCIRVKYKRTRNGDIETRVVEAADVVSVIFPILKDAPYRRLARNVGGSEITIETLPTAMELFPLQIMVPHNNNIYRDDLIFRLFRDVSELKYKPDYLLKDPSTMDMMDGTAETDVRPIVLVLQVKENLGTFGVESLVWSKFNCTYSDEPLPQEMLDTVVELSNRRLALGW
jgi:hypothetical protein